MASYFDRVKEIVDKEVARLLKGGYSKKQIDEKALPRITKLAESKVTRDMFRFK